MYTTLGKQTALQQLGVVKTAIWPFKPSIKDRVQDGYEGAVDTLEEAKDKIKETLNPTPLWRKALPYAAGAGGVALAYPLLRRQHLSMNPELRKIQQKSKGRLTLMDFHPSEVHPDEQTFYQKLPPWLYRLYGKLSRGADDFRLVRSGDTAQRLDPVQGALFSAAEGLRKHPKADIDLTRNFKRIKELADKKIEADFFNKHVPGFAPKTYGTVKKYLKVPKGAEGRKAALRRLQAHLNRKYPNGYIIKPRNAASTGTAIFNDMSLEKQLNRNSQEGAWVRDWFKGKADDYLIQERIPTNEQSLEYRVHAVGNQILPGAMQDRWGVGNPITHRQYVKEIMDQVQPKLNMLPTEMQAAPLNMDLMRDANGRWRLIESNAGGGSGFYIPELLTNLPWAPGPHALYKSVTGRQSPTMAGVKALGIGAGAGAGTALLTNKD